MKVKFFYSGGFAGWKDEEIIEVDDDTTDKELNEMLQDWLGNYIESAWYKIESEGEECKQE